VEREKVGFDPIPRTVNVQPRNDVARTSGAFAWRRPDDVVFTVEYSVRAAQMAVSTLLGIDRKIPPVTPYAASFHAQFEALIKAFK
jgi:myosin-crossreactive antigen